MLLDPETWRQAQFQPWNIPKATMPSYTPVGHGGGGGGGGTVAPPPATGGGGQTTAGGGRWDENGIDFIPGYAGEDAPSEGNPYVDQPEYGSAGDFFSTNMPGVYDAWQAMNGWDKTQYRDNAGDPWSNVWSRDRGSPGVGSLLGGLFGRGGDRPPPTGAPWYFGIPSQTTMTRDSSMGGFTGQPPAAPMQEPPLGLLPMFEGSPGMRALPVGTANGIPQYQAPNGDVFGYDTSGGGLLDLSDEPPTITPEQRDNDSQRYSKGAVQIQPLPPMSEQDLLAALAGLNPGGVARSTPMMQAGTDAPWLGDTEEEWWDQNQDAIDEGWSYIDPGDGNEGYWQR